MKRPFPTSVMKGLIEQSSNRAIEQSSNRAIVDFFASFNLRTFLPSLGIVLMLMVCLPVTNAIAQVEWSSRYVTLATADQINPSVAKPPNAEYTVVVWEDRRSDTSDIYAQMIESATGLAMWDPIDGVAVCTAIGAQRNPRAAYDSLGGVIIVWEDYRDRWRSEILDTTVMDIYAHRIILSNGQLDANWSSNPDGVPVCARTGQRARGPRIAGSTDGAYITWTDFRNSTGHPNYYNRDVYIQYLLVSTGSHPAGYNWVGNGVNVTIANPCPAWENQCDQQNPDIVLDFSVGTQRNRYGAIVVYEDNRIDPWQIFADNIGADGSNRWGFDLHVAENLQAEQVDPHIASTGSGGTPHLGAVVTWQDTRNLMYTEEDLYAQLITPAGNYGWSQSGEAVCTADLVQRRPRIAASGSDVLIVWEDLRDEATAGVDVYCNAFDAGSATPTWQPSTAGLLCDEMEDQLVPEVDILDDFVVAWEDWRSGDADIYGNLLYVIDPTQYRWPGTGQPITLGKHGQIKPQVSGEVIVWQDGRRQPIAGNRLDQRADTNIYAQKLGGECDLPTEMLWRDEFVKWSWPFDATSHRMAVDREGSQYVTWVEARVMGESTMEHVFVQKLDRDGVPKWLNDGVLVSGGEDPGTEPDICVDDEEGCFVTWVKGGNQIHLAHVDYNGDVVESLNVSANILHAGQAPRVVEDDAGGVLIGYHNTANDVVLAHYDGGLNWIDNRLIGAGGLPWAGLKMSKDRLGGTWLVWYDPSIDYLGGHYNGAGLPAGPVGVGGFVSIGNQFDIDTDYLSSSQPKNQTQYDCLFAGVGTEAAPARQDVWVARMNFVGGALKITGTSNITENNLRPTGQGLAHDSWHPAISADSLAVDWSNPYAPEIGGALISFTNSYTDPNVQQTRYSVLSGRVTWNWDSFLMEYIFAGYSPGQHSDYVLDDDMTHEARSDIAVRMGDFEKSGANDPVYGVVVWSSDNTSGCLSPLALRAQLIDYSDGTQSTAFKWSATGTPVARLYGTTEQIEPMIKSTPIGGEFVPNYPLPVLWSDSRSGTRCLLMTRVYNDPVLAEMRWIKEAANTSPIPADLRLQQGYPHPVSFSQHSGFTLPYAIDEDADAVIEFHDMLGRRAVVLTGVRLTAASSFHHISASTYQSLAPGLYQLSVVTAQTRAQRRIVLVR
jgi:hypothetical protein